MVPDVILSVGELPRGLRGKADYRAVLELVESHATTSAARASREPNRLIQPARTSAVEAGVQHNDVAEVSDMQTEDMDDWRWWRQVLVRGSGFPANGVLRLASEGLARKADSLVNADRGSEVVASVPRGVW